jgi:hypothetical protein
MFDLLPLKKLCFFSCVLVLAPALVLAEVPDAPEDEEGVILPMLRKLLAPRENKVVPIALPKDDSRLEKSFQTRQTQWVEALLLADFPLRNADAPWLKEAVAIFQEAAPYLSGEIYTDPISDKSILPPPELIARGKALHVAGCDDPLFNLIIAFLEASQSKRTPEQMALAEKRLPDLLKGNDSPHLKLFACCWVWGGRYDHRATKDLAKRDAMAKMIPRYFKEALDASASPEDSLGFYKFIQYNQSYVLFYMKWKEAETDAMIEKSKMASWLKDFYKGEKALDLAWKLRGSGFANTVTEEGWQGFYLNLNKAKTYFYNSWKANPQVPFAASKMIGVTMAGAGVDGLTLRDWFDRATEACFDHIESYTAMLHAYKPRWGGSHELMLAFGKACADTRRYDTQVPSVLNHAIYRIGSELPCRTVLYEDPETCRRVIDYGKAMVARAKTEPEKHYALSFALVRAFLARDYAGAASYDQALKEPIRSGAANTFSLYGILPHEWKGWLNLQPHPTTFAQLQRAESAYQKGDLASALPIYQQLSKLPLVTSKDATAALIMQRLAAIAVEQRFSTGNWVKLTEDEQKILWRTSSGTAWDSSKAGVLSVLNEKSWLTSRVSLDARVGLDFEVKARLDNPADLQSTQFGCVIGYRPGHYGYATAVCGITEAQPTKRGAALVSFFWSTTNDNPPVPLDLKRDSSFRVRSHQGNVTLWVDDVEIFTRPLDELFDRRSPTQDPGQANHLLAFGGRQFPKGLTRIKDIEFRKLK